MSGEQTKTRSPGVCRHSRAQTFYDRNTWSRTTDEHVWASLLGGAAKMFSIGTGSLEGISWRRRDAGSDWTALRGDFDQVAHDFARALAAVAGESVPAMPTLRAKDGVTVFFMDASTLPDARVCAYVPWREELVKHVSSDVRTTEEGRRCSGSGLK